MRHSRRGHRDDDHLELQSLRQLNRIGVVGRELSWNCLGKHGCKDQENTKITIMSSSARWESSRHGGTGVIASDEARTLIQGEYLRGLRLDGAAGSAEISRRRRGRRFLRLVRLTLGDQFRT